MDGWLEVKIMFLSTLYWKVTKTQKNMFQKLKDPLYIGPD